MAVTQKPTMTVNEVVMELRALGMRVSNRYAADSIESGHWPFGSVASTGTGRRRHFEIWRADFQRWLEERCPAADTQNANGGDR